MNVFNITEKRPQMDIVEIAGGKSMASRKCLDDIEFGLTGWASPVKHASLIDKTVDCCKLGLISSAMALGRVW